MEPAPSSHRWRFFRLGGFDQVRLETSEDLLHLRELDQKLWAALSCPVNGLELDSRTLAMLDTDGDGRVRVPEVVTAVNWVCSVLRDMAPLLAGSPALPLSAIDDGNPEGLLLLVSARRILELLGKDNCDAISIEDVTSTEALLKDAPLNGDGVVTPDSARDEGTRRLIGEILDCMGGVEDRSGNPGTDADRVEAFFTAAAQYAGWWSQGRADAAIHPFGDDTAEAAAAVEALRTKIDDYFTRCSLAAFDPKAAEALNPALATYEALANRELGADAELVTLPLARIAQGRPLPLTDGVNPAWAKALETLRDGAFASLFGTADSMDRNQWERLKTVLAPYRDWQAAKAGPEVERLGSARIEEVLAGSDRTRLMEIIEEDLHLQEQVERFEAVARLVHYTRDIMTLLNNFVAFRDFYGQDRKAVFQAGTLYLDGRACELCIRVANPDAHSALATLSRTYLAYCRCTRAGSAEQIFIAAAFTGGDSDNLMVGRNGVFYDRKGQDWDATIVKIVEHPISVRQAFWAPYKRMARMAGEQVAKFAAAKDSAVDASAGAKLADIGAKPEAAKTPFDVGKFAGIFAAIGLALGAIGTAVATVLGGFMGLPLWQMPLAAGGVLLLISGPSMLIAYMKLRQRNLAPILDAGGWAVNTRAMINIPFGATLTRLAELPRGAQRSLRDPFAEKNTPWKRWAVLLILFVLLGMAWDKGYIKYLAETLAPVFRGETVNATQTPARPQPPVTNQTAPAQPAK